MRAEPMIAGYAVIAPIAHGNTGDVYRATDRRNGDTVALKVLDPRFASDPRIVARLFLERTVSERATHANLVDVRAAKRSDDGVPYLVVEFLAGESLAELAERGRMELATILGIAAQIAAGIAALHDVGVVHCDLTLDNVFVIGEPASPGFPRIKIIDYGVAYIVGTATDTKTVAGTPTCMAPEQWRGEPTRATDVYALGCVLFELLTGDSVFTGTVPALLIAHTSAQAPRVSWQRVDVPLALDALIARALDKAPDERPSMHEMMGALDELLGQPPQRLVAAPGCLR